MAMMMCCGNVFRRTKGVENVGFLHTHTHTYKPC